MADEGDGQKPVTDMRIFCGEVKSRDALAWKVATAGSAMLSTSLQSGGLVQVWNPVSQVTKRVERFRADYFAGKTSELCYECGDRPAKSTLYSYVSVKHPFIGPVGKPGETGPTTQFVPDHLLLHHVLSNEYRECDFLADFILRSAEHDDGSHDLLELRVDTPVGVDNLIMKADQPVTNAQAEIPRRAKLETAPTGCKIHHGHAKLLPWHSLDMDQQIHGKARRTHLQDLKRELEAVTLSRGKDQSLGILDARSKIKQLLIQLSPIYSKFLTAFPRTSDPLVAIGVAKPRQKRQAIGSGVEAGATQKKKFRLVNEVSDRRLHAMVGSMANRGMFDSMTISQIVAVLEDTAKFESVRTGQKVTLKPDLTGSKNQAVKALCVAFGIQNCTRASVWDADVDDATDVFVFEKPANTE